MERRTSVTRGDGLDFVISDGSLDRHGTRINPKGWDLTSFKRNPIALFSHSSAFPIGTWENVRVEGDQLVGRLVLAAKGTSARIDELISLVEQGVLRAVSVGFSILEFGVPGKSQYDFDRQELLEVSLVSVPSNTNALAMARALNISPETLSLAFGEHAEARLGATTAGGHAEKRNAIQGSKTMKTLSQRIEDAQNTLNAQRDRLAELNAADSLDLDAIDQLNLDIEVSERTVKTLKTSEARIGMNTVAPGAQPPSSPATNRRPLGFPQREVKGFDLFVRAAVVNGISLMTGRERSKVLDERYPGHEATAIMCRADQTIGTTTVSGWASELVQAAYGEFIQALIGFSIYPALRARGVGVNFDGVGSVILPGRTAGGAAGGFVAEGQPIRVGRVTTTSTTMTPKKMGVIIPFSKELTKRSTPAIEAIVQRSILEDTAAVLDPLILDAVASSTARPAGLLYGVSAASSGYAGGDYKAVIEDFKALLAPFIAANAADGITVVMNSTQGLNLALMEGPVGNPGWFNAIRDRINMIESTHATANRLVALRNSDFATATGDAPEFDLSEQATIHMEDTTPLEIVSGTGPTTADPVRSLWQTNSVAIRMLMDISWKMRRTGMVQWIDTTTW